MFWNQGSNAQQSRNRYVSTGSGSCDWHDRVDADLKATLTAAMEREFREEAAVHLEMLAEENGAAAADHRVSSRCSMA